MSPEGCRTAGICKRPVRAFAVASLPLPDDKDIRGDGTSERPAALPTTGATGDGVRGEAAGEVRGGDFGHILDGAAAAASSMKRSSRRLWALQRWCAQRLRGWTPVILDDTRRRRRAFLQRDSAWGQRRPPQ